MKIKDRLITLRKELGKLLYEFEEVEINDKTYLKDKEGKLYKFNESGEIVEHQEEIIEDVVAESAEEVNTVEVETIDKDIVVDNSEELNKIQEDYNSLKNNYDEIITNRDIKFKEYEDVINSLNLEIERLKAEPLMVPAEVEIKTTNNAVINKSNFKAAEYFK